MYMNTFDRVDGFDESSSHYLQRNDKPKKFFLKITAKHSWEHFRVNSTIS